MKTKTLVNVQMSAKDGKVTLTGDIAEVDFDVHMIQRVTIGYLNPDNRQWPRHIQLSHEAVFVSAFGKYFSLNDDDLVRLATLVEPKTSYPPIFKSKIADKLEAQISSELDPSFRWEVSDRIDKAQQWSVIEGESSNTLSSPERFKGKFVRCVAFSDAGSMTSNPVKV